MKIKYLGHSAFEILAKKENKEYKILFDPFLIKAPDYNYSDTDYIFLSHGHQDHLGSAIEISKKTNAKIVAIFELANYCISKGAKNSLSCSFGSWLNFPFGKAILVFASHSSSTDGEYLGNPCGFILKLEDKTIYFAGDTGLFSDMKMFKELYKPDISILPIGGTYTMDIEHAKIASSWLDSSIIIPMHYNTFDAIKVDIEEFKKEINSIGKTPLVLEISKSKEF